MILISAVDAKPAPEPNHDMKNKVQLERKLVALVVANVGWSNWVDVKSHVSRC
jgi:hypothetical protein